MTKCTIKELKPNRGKIKFNSFQCVLTGFKYCFKNQLNFSNTCIIICTLWFAGFTTARATQGSTPGSRKKIISYSDKEWDLLLKSFWHNLTKYSNLAYSEKIPHPENLRSTRPVYVGSDNMIQLRSVLQFKIMRLWNWFKVYRKVA